ncbi:MAG: AAA family ATPase [Polyangiaceae bacterium]
MSARSVPTAHFGFWARHRPAHHRSRSLIVLEEPDVGLHPARIHLLARLLEQATRERGVQVLATTHSPILLAHLSAESRGCRCPRSRRPGVSVCERLGNLKHFDTLRDSKQLDHLVSTGWIERAL